MTFYTDFYTLSSVSVQFTTNERIKLPYSWGNFMDIFRKENRNSGQAITYNQSDIRDPQNAYLMSENSCEQMS